MELQNQVSKKEISAISIAGTISVGLIIILLALMIQGIFGSTPEPGYPGQSYLSAITSLILMFIAGVILTINIPQLKFRCPEIPLLLLTAIILLFTVTSHIIAKPDTSFNPVFACILSVIWGCAAGFCARHLVNLVNEEKPKIIIK